MTERQDYIFGLTGGTILSMVHTFSVSRILETIVFAALGAAASYLISKLMRYLGSSGKVGEIEFKHRF